MGTELEEQLQQQGYYREVTPAEEAHFYNTLEEAVEAEQEDVTDGAEPIGTAAESHAPELDEVTAQSQTKRQEKPIDEFELGDFALAASFPHVFMRGTGYSKWAADLSLSERLHLLNQYSTSAAQD